MGVAASVATAAMLLRKFPPAVDRDDLPSRLEEHDDLAVYHIERSALNAPGCVSMRAVYAQLSTLDQLFRALAALMRALTRQ